MTSKEALNPIEDRLPEILEQPVDEDEVEREIVVADFTESYDPLPPGRLATTT